MHYPQIVHEHGVVYLEGRLSHSLDRGPMKVLFVFAHPEPRSLNGALRDVAIRELETQGNEVRMSDLYAGRWKSQVDRADFPSLAADASLKPARASADAFAAKALTDDVRAEQDKLLWADTLILQFPLWWFSMPAILKGWVDRVYAYGFAYGVGEHSDQHWGDRLSLIHISEPTRPY